MPSDRLRAAAMGLWERLVWLLWTLPVTIVTELWTSLWSGLRLLGRINAADTGLFGGPRNDHDLLDVVFAILWAVLIISLILAFASIYIWVVVASIGIGVAIYLLVWLYRYQANHTWREALRGEDVWR